MKIIFVLSVLLFLAATVGAAGRIRRCVSDEPDGCSNGGIGQWKNTFTSSCDKHDMCYICGGAQHDDIDWSRKFCDDAFLRDMRKACSKVQRKVRKKGFWWSYSFSFPRADCNIWANIYYRAVRIFGHRSYNKKFCRSSCIKTHGDPGRTITP